MNKFPGRLKALRVEHNMSQHELADLIDTTTGVISKYERGVTTPSVERLVRLADIFHASCDHMLGRDQYAGMPRARHRR